MTERLHKMVNGVKIYLTDTEEAELRTEWAAWAAEEARTRYIADRRAAYPSIQEQLDMLYKDKLNRTETWVEAITAVKLKYPKP